MTRSDVVPSHAHTCTAAVVPAAAAVRLPARLDRSYHVTGNHVRERIGRDGWTRHGARREPRRRDAACTWTGRRLH